MEVAGVWGRKRTRRGGRKASGAELKPEGVWKLEELVADESQDPESASESGRRVRDAGSEGGQIGAAAAASCRLWH